MLVYETYMFMEDISIICPKVKRRMDQVGVLHSAHILWKSIFTLLKLYFGYYILKYIIFEYLYFI